MILVACQRLLIIFTLLVLHILICMGLTLFLCYYTSGRVLGQLPPGQLPPGQLPPDNYPPDNYPLGQIPPGQLPPQITEFPKHKSTKFTSHKVYKSQSLQVTKSTQITGTKSQYIRVQILQNTSKYKGSAWLWQTLVIWWLLKKPFWGGIKPKT